MSRKAYGLSGVVALTIAGTIAARAETWVPVHGNVRLADGTPICAMVLANGQYMFSCDGSGSYSLNVPLDANGQITLFSFADGFAPFSTTMGPSSFPFGVQMQTAAPNSPLISMTRSVECAAGIPNWVHISGSVESYGGEPLCAMVLSNGQQMFTCGDSQGRYDLNVPVDENRNVTAFGFADGFQPYSETLVVPKCDMRYATFNDVNFVFQTVETPYNFGWGCAIEASATNNSSSSKTTILLYDAWDSDGRYFGPSLATFDLRPGGTETEVTPVIPSALGQDQDLLQNKCNAVAGWEPKLSPMSSSR